jgi:hypothetical protein
LLVDASVVQGGVRWRGAGVKADWLSSSAGNKAGVRAGRRWRRHELPDTP